MKTRTHLFTLAICLLAFVIVTSCSTSEIKPNVIVIFTDDMGYGDIGCYGAEGYHTPSLDQLAQEGMKFTDFTVANCICTPSRAGLLTGRYPERWGYTNGVFFPRDTTGMPESEITIAEMLKEQGYSTAIVGKWHLGHYPKYLPTNQGFDQYFGIPYSNDMWQDGAAQLAYNFKLLDGKTMEDFRSIRSQKWKKINPEDRGLVPLLENDKVIEWPVDQRQLTTRYTEKAIEFINQNKEKPFFLYLAHAMPHVPLYVSDKFKGKTARGLYGDVIEEIDWSVGQIIESLRANMIDKNTLVIFTSDNGPWLVMKENGGSAGKLRGGKMTTYEGGQRVPCIAWWPGTIPEGTICDHHLSSLDLLPTIGKLAKANIPSDRTIDGLDMSKVLKGDFKNVPQREFFLYHYGKEKAIRVGDWKYRNGPVSDIPKKGGNDIMVDQLFNLDEDPREEQNLADKYPEKVKELAKRAEDKLVVLENECKK